MFSELGAAGAWVWIGLAVVMGLIFGSAINALVWRVYVGRSWVRGRSQCPDCGHELAARDLVPVLSWVALGGKCRYCGAPIKDHPVVELVAALAFGVSAAALVPVSTAGVVRLGFWIVILTLLLALAVFDQRWLILPDKLMFPLIVTVTLFTATMAVLTGAPRVLIGALIAAMLAGGAFFALVYFSKGRAMGGGDIKLAFAMGLLLGLKGTAVAMLVAFNAAAVVGIALIATRRRKRHDQIPFGPFLVGGAIISFLFSQQLIEQYMRLTGLV
jgi:leader peptidase (prepilin peptidase) / N-methyltransferase